MHQIIANDILGVCENIKAFEKNIKGKTFLISGGAGFIGSWCADVLNQMGAKKIIVVDNLSSGSKKNIAHLQKNKNFNFIKKDICKYNLPANIKFDYIMHLASIATPGIYQKYPIETLDSNLEGTKKMLTLGVKHKIKGFLLTSTSEVYGNPEDKNVPTAENYYGYVNSYGARAMYDEAKRGAEAYCYAFGLKYPTLPIRIVRIFNTYGPRLDLESTSQYGRVLIKFIDQALQNKPITIYGDGLQTRSFCYITDQLIGLFNLLFTPKVNHTPINIGNNKEYTIIELAKLIVKITKSKSKLNFDAPANYNLADDPRRRCPNLTKAKKLLNYQTKISLKTGLIKTSQWLKEAR